MKLNIFIILYKRINYVSFGMHLGCVRITVTGFLLLFFQILVNVSEHETAIHQSLESLVAGPLLLLKIPE